MDAWHVIFAIGAYLVIMRLYTWCQVRYWCSPECEDTWGRRPGRPDRMVGAIEKIEVINNAGPDHDRDSARVFRDEPALRESNREAIGGK